MNLIKPLIVLFAVFLSGFAISQCGPLPTAYNQNNGQDGIMFDVVAVTSIEITSFDVNCGGATHDFEIYYRTGTHVGFENAAAGWNLIGTANGVTGPINVATPIPAVLSVILCAGDVGAFYIASTGTPTIDYTNGVAVGNVLAADANLQILTGTGKDYPWGASFTPRSPNITAYYNCLSMSCCALQTLTTVVGPCVASTYQTTGQITFLNPPAGGQLIVEDCDGNQQTFNAPFVSPINYTITGQDPDNGPCDITAYFTADPGCTLTENYTAPVPCACDSTWTLPTPCSTDPPINLDALITGDVGGTWSGTGVTGSTFDPSVGTQTVTYTAPLGCAFPQTITVNTTASATWTIPPVTCANASDINLDALITGTAGGTWSGTGVTGNLFDPTSGTQNVTYTAGTAPCDDAVTQSITVTPSLDPTWVGPGTICETAGTVDLNALITGDTGGTWSGSGVTGSTFDPTGLSGSISIIYTIGAAPCVGTYVQDIIVNPDVDPTWTAPTMLCQTAPPVDLSTFVTGTAGGTWSGTGITGSTFDPAVGTQTITYNVGIAPCDESLVLTITIGAPLDASWTTLTMCQSSAPVDMAGQITGDVGGTWSGTGMTGSVFDPFSGTQSITYSLSGGGCIASITQDIIVVDPAITIVGTNISCFGLTDGSAAATVAGGSGNYTYSWDTTPVQTTATATGLGDGTYTLTVTDVDGGCAVTETVTITSPAEIILVMSGLDVCAPATGSASVSASGGSGGFTYLWSPTSGTDATVTGLDSAMAYVTVTDINGCTADDSIFVNVSPLPIITISNDTTIFSNDVAYLTATGGGSYLWIPDVDMDCDTCQSPNVAPDETTSYCVTVTNDYGCVDSTCTVVTIELVCGEVYVPSAFSPNGDGENEFECVYSDCMESFAFDIFNRWGEKVFTTSSMNICWDGTWKGKELNSAVYVYVIEGSLIDGSRFSQKGNISLIR